MKNNEMGIYIHIPFCVQKCVYCDFLSASATEETKKTYVDKLIEEIKGSSNNKLVKTVFIGGGTPSCLCAKHIDRIMKALQEHFQIDDNAEVTIECNPGTLDQLKAYTYKECGINRISFGVQSLNDSELKMLGRIHSEDDFYESLKIARANGIENINADVISAIPGQTIDSYKNTLKKMVETGVTHISAYSLIVEEGTYLNENLSQFPELPDEDAERNMYYMTREMLTTFGYKQYEISNYAKPGYESKHNLSYWERGNYMGFGIGAASLMDNVRYSNTSSLKTYLSFENVHEIREDVTQLSINDQMSETMFLGLRKTDGINIEQFEKEYGKKMKDVYRIPLENNINRGLLAIKNGNILLTKRGVDISNMVMSDFLL